MKYISARKRASTAKKNHTVSEIAIANDLSSGMQTVVTSDCQVRVLVLKFGQILEVRSSSNYFVELLEV